LFTRHDLVDTIVRHLRPPRKEAAAPRLSPDGPIGRLFLTESDIKKRLLTGGGTRLTIPPDAIISPLAADWLVLKGVTVVRE
jgi:hypothetical protein